MNRGDLRGVLWADAGSVALTCDVKTETVWNWVRAGLVLARRLPGARGRVRIALDADGWPVPVTTRGTRNVMRTRNEVRQEKRR